jgi:hypothetical protein
LTWTDPTGGRPFYDHLMDFLRTHPDEYAGAIEKHFVRHLTPFVQPAMFTKNQI